MQDHFTEKPSLIDPEVDTGKAEIAIVDDDASFSFMLKDYLLSSAQLKSDIFSSGEAFLKQYRPKDPRIIILDYDLGEGLDGLKLLQKIIQVNSQAKIIMVSSQDELEIAIETMRKGAADYFIKTNQSVFANVVGSLMKIMKMERNRWN